MAAMINNLQHDVHSKSFLQSKQPSHGNDVTLYSSGSYFIGKFDGGSKKTGWGQLRQSEGSSYEGYYFDNKRDGEGIYKWSDGSMYKGDFKDDLRHGHGELFWPNGENYIGGFVKDMKHGFGIYTWPSNGRFEGNFEENKKHGYGVFSYLNGDTFQGFYKDDHRWGPGIFTYSTSGHQDVGIWKGKSLVRVCSIIEDAFLLEHLKYHFINAGQNIPFAMKDLNSTGSASTLMPGSMVYDNFQVNDLFNTESIPVQFAYRDILNGIRGVRSSKGNMETSSELLLHASSTGDLSEVKSVLEEGLVNPNVTEKTGFCSLLAAAVNCHTGVLNLLLDHGANINQLTDEGLSALLACHILLYAEQYFVENIAEKMADENLFNTTDIERKSGAVSNRNDRKLIMSMYEQLNRPFMSAKKTIPVAGKAGVSIKKKRLSPESMDMYSRVSFVGTGGFGVGVGGGRVPDENEVCVSWKVDFFKKSISHIKDVEAINKNFKQTMLDPSSSFLSSAINNSYVIGSKNNPERTASVSSCTHDFSDADNLYNMNNNTASDMFNNREKALVSTTLASNFGDDPSSIFNIVEDQRKMNNEMMIKFITNERRPHLQSTINLLLDRGADPNASPLPMSVLFYAVKSADPDAVHTLLRQNADTSSRLKTMNLCPLHISVALPCAEGVEITRLLLQYGADPNLRDDFPHKEPSDGKVVDGRTPLHIVCSREDNYRQCQKIVKLLMEYNADPNLLCLGNAPLSLAIASGNDLVVDTLLKYKADPSLNLMHGLGSILCVATSFQAERRRTPYDRMKLIEKLVKAGADMLTPVLISDRYPPGTVVDYGYHVFSQDRRIAFTPYHALSSIERECYNSRRQMLDVLGSYLREVALRKEKELAEKCFNETMHANDSKSKQSIIVSSSNRDENSGLRMVTIKIHIPRTVNHSNSEVKLSDNEVTKGKGSSVGVLKKRFRYCYECGRTIGVRLNPCTRCKEVFFCSKACKVKAWNLRHREECSKAPGNKSLSLQSRLNSPTPTSDASAKVDNLASQPVNLNKTPRSTRNLSFLPRI